MVSGPYADASFAPIVDADVSAVAAQALLGDHLDGRRIPLTGPPCTGAQPPRRHRAAPEFADAYIALQAAATQQPAVVTGHVEAILGRPATPFAHWVRTHRDLFNN